ncbi:MAG: peptidylprolyl isomerase [Candidatus Sericytochromatia bacterium]
MELSTRKFYTNLFLGSLSALAFWATYQFTNVTLEGKNYIASINGTRFITAKEFREKIGSVQGQYAMQMGVDYKGEKGKESYNQLKNQLMQELILTKLMLGNAEQEKIVVTDEMVNQEIKKIKAQNFQNNDLAFKKAMKKNNIKEEALTDILKEKMILQKYVEKLMNDNVKVSEKDLKDAYNTRKVDFTEKESVEASHILVKSEAEAKKIYDEVKSGKDFSELAKKYSQDPGSKNNGGSLGYFSKGQMVPEFEKSAFSLKVGEISQPVKTSFGYHILKKTGYKPEHTMPFEVVKPNLEQQVKAEKQRDFFTKWREKSLKEADVKFNQGYESYDIAKKEDPKKEAQVKTNPEEKK